MNKLPGYTLMEISIASALMVIVGSVIVYITIDASNGFSRTNTAQQRTSDVERVVLNEMYRAIRLATGFPATASVSGVTYTAYPYDSNQASRSLIMQVPSITNAAGEPSTDPSQVDLIIFTQDDTGNIRQIVQPNANSFRTKTDRIMIENASLGIVQRKTSFNTNRVVHVEVTANGKISIQNMVARND